MRHKLVTFALAVLTLPLGFSNCASPRSQGLQIKIGGHTTQFGAPLKIAESKGFFTKEGLTASIRLVESSKDSMAAMESGELDVIIASMAAGSFNMIRDGDLVMLADGGRAVPNVIIRKDLWDNKTIKQISDLKGRTIMTPREGSSSYYGLSKILQGFNLTIADVTPKYLTDPAALAALEAKQVDAAVLSEPDATNAVERGLGVRYNIEEVAKFFPANGQQYMGIFTRRKTLNERPDLIRKFLNAYIEAVRFYDQGRNKNQPQRDESIQIIAQYTGADPKIIDKTIWMYVSPAGRPDVEFMREMQDYFVQKKLVDRAVDLNNVVHLELLPESK